ncbi:MAG: DNA alkylation repair protein [Pirellula sp.]
MSDDVKAIEASNRLLSLASPEIALSSMRFFKTGPGQYGHGDTFIGVRVPMLRKVAREFREMPINQVEILLHSPIHEERMLALLVLVQGVAKCHDDHRQVVFDLYLRNTQHINNWDLVDTSAPAIVGGYLKDKPRKVLVQLTKSKSLWERRIAIVATQHFIRLGEFDDTLDLSRLLLSDQEDLIHKASGWMLREVGERDKNKLIEFLDKHAKMMPRTMLRYAIEHFPPEIHRTYLAK